MEYLDILNAIGKWFDEFIKHGSFVSILLALYGSWFATAFFKIPIRWYARPERVVFYVRALDIAIAFGICAWTWPNDWRFIWGFVVGFGSPWIYTALAALVCWKVPAAKPFLSLREFAMDDSPPTGDDNRLPPGDTK